MLPDLDSYPPRLPDGTTGNDLTLDGLLSTPFIQFDIEPLSRLHEEGLLIWNDDEKCLNIGMSGGVVNLQVGQEQLFRGKNGAGVDILNGTPVYLKAGEGPNPEINIASNDSEFGVYAIGLATEDILASQFGYVTTFGLVRELDTSAWPKATPIWLGVNGQLTATRPTPGTDVVLLTLIGIVWRQHANEGVLLIQPEWLNRNMYLSDVLPGVPTPGQHLSWTAAGRFELKTPSVMVPVALSSYTDLNSRNLDQNLHGGIDPVSIAETVSSGAPANVTIGLGKVVLAVIAGADISGTVTITGTSVDRNTGAETGADTDTIAIDGLTTDSISTDTEGNPIYSLTNAYITSKWFKGAITISTADVNLSDVDVYVVAFEQFNDTSNLTLQTLDVTFLPINAAAWVYMYLYTVKVTGDIVDIENVASVALPSADSVANRFYRLREGLINEELDGTTDGVLLEAFLGPSPLQYISQMTIKIWADLQLPITLT